MKIKIQQSKDTRFHSMGFWKSFLYTQEGDLNVSQSLAIFLCVAGVAGFLYVNIFNPTKSTAVEIASFSFMGAAFSLTLLSSIPTDKAQILANSRVPGEVAKGISEAASGASETLSTDIQEIKSRTGNNDTISQSINIPDDRG